MGVSCQEKNGQTEQFSQFCAPLKEMELLRAYTKVPGIKKQQYIDLHRSFHN